MNPVNQHTGWQQAQLKTLCDVFPGKTPERASYSDSGDIRMIKFRDVKDDGTIDYLNGSDGWVDSRYADTSALVELPIGAILLTNAAHSSEHIGKKAALVRRPPDTSLRHCFVGELTAIRSKTPALSTEWFYYNLQTESFRRLLAHAIEGAHLIPRTLGKIPVSYPIPSVQEAHLTITRAIEETLSTCRAKLAAVRRLKTALMQQLFTRGISGRHTKFQQTKIGEIPEVWTVKRGRELFTLFSSSNHFPEHFHPDGECLYLKVEDFNTLGNEREICHASLRFRAAENPSVKLHAPGNVIFAKRGAALTKNRVRLLGLPSAVDPNLMVLKPIDGEFTGLFARYYLEHFKLSRLSEDAGIPQLNNRDLYPRLFARPDPDEQEDISKLLRASEDTIAAVMAELSSVERLKCSVLQNLLTGRVRVRIEP